MGLCTALGVLHHGNIMLPEFILKTNLGLGSLLLLVLCGLLLLLLCGSSRCGTGPAEEGLVFLLSLDERVLEGVCVWLVSMLVSDILPDFGQGTFEHLLSELANRMASVTASASPSLTSAAAFQTQLRSEPTLGESFISGTTGGSAR